MILKQITKSDSPHRSHAGFGLRTCRICGKRETGQVIRRHIQKYHLGEKGIGMPRIMLDLELEKERSRCRT